LGETGAKKEGRFMASGHHVQKPGRKGIKRLNVTKITRGLEDQRQVQSIYGRGMRWEISWNWEDLSERGGSRFTKEFPEIAMDGQKATISDWAGKYKLAARGCFGKKK